jgi:N-methylhydantoinase A
VKRMGIDIGGTFTDIVIIDETTQELVQEKILTTAKDPTRAIVEYIDKKGLNMEEVTFLVHGTTIATNAVVERRGAKLGLITTIGQKDRLDIQRTNLLAIYDLYYQKPQALIPRTLRREVEGRTLYDGTILTPINEEEVVKVARDLVEDNGVEGICICFLNSYVNPEQEQQVKKTIKKRFPEVYVVTSSETLAEVLEYERFSTTVINAFLMPEMDRYLARLEEFFSKRKLPKDRFMLMQGNGGIMSASLARELAAATVESGPAGGVIGSQYLANLQGESNIITLDMGGTTTDTCLIRGGQPSVTVDSKVAGHPMRFPLLDIYSIGAGGGSIAWIDDGGGLHVGPVSAGADPGPACYASGGAEPTVSDAHVILGRLHPECPLGGKVSVSYDLAKKAVDKIASHYKISTEKAAASIIKVVNENMVNALRVISVEKGVDPSEYILVAYGGAGGMHAGALMKRMNIAKCITPRIPGCHSALGLLTSDIKHDFVRSILQPTTTLDIDFVHQIYQSLVDRAKEVLVAEGIKDEDILIEYKCDMRYRGQAYVIAIIPFSWDAPREKQLVETERTFHRVHRELYKHVAETEPTEIISLRVSANGKQKKPNLKMEVVQAHEPKIDKRSVYFEDVDSFLECHVYNRIELPVGFCFKGPAIVYQIDSTTLVYPGQIATIDEFGNMIFEQGNDAGP